MTEALPGLSEDFAPTQACVRDFREKGHTAVRGLASADEVAAYRPAIAETRNPAAKLMTRVNHSDWISSGGKLVAGNDSNTDIRLEPIRIDIQFGSQIVIDPHQTRCLNRGGLLSTVEPLGEQNVAVVEGWTAGH